MAEFGMRNAEFKKEFSRLHYFGLRFDAIYPILALFASSLSELSANRAYGRLAANG